LPYKCGFTAKSLQGYIDYTYTSNNNNYNNNTYNGVFNGLLCHACEGR